MNSSKGFIVIFVYVDDLALERTNHKEIIQLKNLLNDKFSIKDLGVLKYFQGFEWLELEIEYLLVKESML